MTGPVGGGRRLTRAGTEVVKPAASAQLNSSSTRRPGRAFDSLHEFRQSQARLPDLTAPVARQPETAQDGETAADLASTVPRAHGTALEPILPATRPAGAERQAITVVICAYTARRLQLLRAAVSAVLEQLLPGDELLVVVDHNSDLLEQVRSALPSAGGPQRCGDPVVRVIANGNARGLSGARNAGAAAARCELVAFLDDDAVPQPGWLSRLAEPFADPEVIGTGGVATPAWERERPAWLPEEFLWVVGCSYRGLPSHAADIRNPIGANMAFRRDVIREAGGFTDGIGRVGRTPLGCEETEFSIRARRATGGRIVQQPSAAVDHVVSADRLRLGYFVHRCWAEGISKAVVSWLMGGDAALASERVYTTRTLPAGVLAGIRQGFGGDSGGFKRSAMIVAGLAVTVAGYLRGIAARRQPRAAEPHEPGRAEQAFTPMWAGEIDLCAPRLPELLVDPDGVSFERARILVRVAGTPLGFLQLDTPAGRIERGSVISRAHEAFGADAAASADAGWTEDRARRVSVIVCTRNRPAGARRALESVLAARHRDIEVIVVDNAPDDDATRVVAEELAARDPRVRYVCEPRAGLSRARNRGLREARGEIIAFTDDDVRVDPLWVHGLLRGFDRGPAVACVTGLVASASLRRPAEQYFDQRVWWSSSVTARQFDRRRGAADSPLHPYTAGIFGTGANFAVSRPVLEALGGFDECLGAGSPTRGGEDLDLFVRLIAAGRSLCYEPSALVWHEHRVDDNSLRRQMYAYGLGLTAYLTKHLLDPGSRRMMLRLIPGGLRHALTLLRRSRRAAEASTLEQGNLTGVELRGMLVGPLAYLRARRSVARERARNAAPPRAGG